MQGKGFALALFFISFRGWAWGPLPYMAYRPVFPEAFHIYETGLGPQLFVIDKND